MTDLPKHGPPARVPKGTRIYAFGDVHGRSDLLANLRAAIQQDAQSATNLEVTVIGLGDYIDRGPDSRGVIDLLLDGFGDRINLVYLRGNHEDVFLKFLADPERYGSLWLSLSGLDFAHSYAIDMHETRASNIDWKGLRDALIACLPVQHLLFFERLQQSYECGNYVFVHGGVVNRVPLAQQSMQNMLWLRPAAPDSDEAFEKVVVHAHTPVNEPFLGSYRINLDTGAYFTNRLSCICLQDSERRLIDSNGQANCDPQQFEAATVTKQSIQ